MNSNINNNINKRISHKENMEIHSTRVSACVQRHRRSDRRDSTIVPSGLGVWLRLHSLKHSIGSSPTVSYHHYRLIPQSLTVLILKPFCYCKLLQFTLNCVPECLFKKVLRQPVPQSFTKWYGDGLSRVQLLI
jgi:hypothetical protein